MSKNLNTSLDVVDDLVYDIDSVLVYDDACNTMSAACHLSCFLVFLVLTTYSRTIELTRTS